MKHRVLVVAALSFAGFIIWMIVIANRGEGDYWWGNLDWIPYGDKLGHLGLIGTLSLMCNLAFHPPKPAILPAWITTVTAILLLLLTLEELSQAVNPHRSCDFFDWLSDLAGLAAGQFLAARLQPRPDAG